MPTGHARKEDLAAIKAQLGVKHHMAVAILEHPESERIRALMEAYEDVRTMKDAVAIIEDPRNQLLCEKCGWTNGMVCPECDKGCGCEYGCTGWRHHEYAHEDDDYDDPDHGVYCRECGAGGSGNPYEECTCWEDYEEQDQEQDAVPVPSPEPRGTYPLGWGPSSGPFPNSGWGS